MDYIKTYTDFLKEHAQVTKPLSIVCDCSNGATGKILEALLPQLGLKDYKILNGAPDPEFTAHGPNPLIPGALDELSKTVVSMKADLGVAFDADGDRAFFVDEKGVVQPSFITAALLFKNSTPPYVADELIYQAHHHMKILNDQELHPSRVGVYFIKQVMKEIQASSGAEFSGHFYFNDFFGADSGIFAMIRIVSILSSLDQTFSQFAENLPKHVMKNLDLKIEGKNWQKIQLDVIKSPIADGAVIEHREGVTLQLSDGWVNIRPSNTEPILRIYAGAPTAERVTAIIDNVKALV